MEDEALLLHRELTVLPEGVQHDDVLLLDGCEGAALDLLPLPLFFVEDVTCVLGLLFAGVEAIVVLVLLLLLSFKSLLDLDHVRDRLLKGIIKEAAVVAKRHSHVRAKSWDLMEQDPGLPNYLRYIDMPEGVDNVFLHGGLGFLLALRVFLFGVGLAGLLKDVMGDAFVWLEAAVDQELVIRGAVEVTHNLGRLLVLVIVLTSVFLNRAHRVHKLADVDARRLGVLGQEVRQLLEVVVQVLRLLQLREEVSLLLLLLRPLLSSLLCFQGLGFDFGLLILTGLEHLSFAVDSLDNDQAVSAAYLANRFLLGGVVQEILGEVLFGVVGLRSEGLGERL